MRQSSKISSVVALPLDDKGTDTLGTKALVGHGNNDEHVGIAAIGDENLAAIEHPFIAFQHSGGLLTCSIGTGIGLSQAEGSNPFTGSQLGQVFHLLLLSTGLQDGGAAEAGMGGKDNARGSAHARKFLDGHAIHDIRATGTAILCRNGDAHKADFGHLFYRLHGETLLFIDFGSQWLYLFLCKFANHLQEELFLFSETEIHIDLCLFRLTII